MWNLPKPGIKSMSPALAGGVLTTGPPGKSYSALSILGQKGREYQPCLGSKETETEKGDKPNKSYPVSKGLSQNLNQFPLTSSLSPSPTNRLPGALSRHPSCNESLSSVLLSTADQKSGPAGPPGKGLPGWELCEGQPAPSMVSHSYPSELTAGQWKACHTTLPDFSLARYGEGQSRRAWEQPQARTNGSWRINASSRPHGGMTRWGLFHPGAHSGDWPDNTPFPSCLPCLVSLPHSPP